MNTKIGFDSKKYLELQSKEIKKRIAQFGKLYLEFGGKLFDDYHASRVLPGFLPDNKLQMLEQLKDDAEIVISISAEAIEHNKIRGDLGITYDEEALRLKEAFEQRGFYVSSIAITRYSGQPSADRFKEKLEAMNIPVYMLYYIEGYPANIPLIMSDEGYGKNDFIKTTRDLVVITAPGPGSGKMATCLSQLYHESKHGIAAGYAKFETFPVWNLPLKHPVNLAYEAATADLDDVNMIDPFHLEAYNKTTVNYNRDVEIFPVLEAMFKAILKTCPYKSPTDMGVNMVGNAICDDEVCKEASRQEIIRRYLHTADQVAKGLADKKELMKQELIMKQADVTLNQRKVVHAALKKEEKTKAPAVAIEGEDGKIITGKTSKLLGACSSALLNVLKEYANIPHDVKIIAPDVIEPIQNLKINYLGSKNPRLHSDEILIALSASAAHNEKAKKALEQLPKLRGLQAHSSVLLSSVDEETYRKLGIQLTCTPKFESRD